MNWKRKSDYHMECGDFYLARFRTNGRWRYSLVHGDRLVGIYDSADDAKAAAEGLA